MEAAGRSDVRLLALARKLSRQHVCDVVVALVRHGIVCAESGDATWYLPAALAEIRDACGAGDTVLAALGVGLITVTSLRTVCRIAGIAAGLQATQVGVAAIAYG